MAVAFRAAGALAQTSGTSITVNYPAGVASGDLLLIHYNTDPATVTTPAGWTKLFGPTTQAGNSSTGYVFWKIAGGSEPSSVAISKSAGGNVAGIMTAYTGCDGTTPIDVFATQTIPTSGTTATTPSVTTTKANTMLLRLYWGYGGSSVTPPGTDTERYDVQQTASGPMVLELATSIQAGTGASGTTTATFATTSFGGMSATIALAPTVSTPVADFTGTPTSGTASLSVTFTDASTNGPTSWAWTFGDGGTSSSQNPSHSYTVAGVYTVTLTATNAGGSNTKTRTSYISVTELIVYAAGGGLDIY